MTSALKTDQAANVKLDVTVTHNRGAHKSRRYTATYGDFLRGFEAEGSTAAEAKAALTVMLVTALDVARNGKPAFARDDNGDLMVAVPAPDGGSQHWRVNGDAKYSASDSRPPAEAFTSCYHMTPIPERRF